MLVLIFQTIVTYLFLRHIAFEDIKDSLRELQDRIRNDMHIKRGQWDTSLYNADPRTPHPSGSNGFTTPLYIITSSGFVIERNQPISGLLDSADFKHMNAFSRPQTLAIVTNDRWRVLSKPILNSDKEIVGLISVAYHNPNEVILESIDKTLGDNLNKINASVRISGKTIDVSKVDVRNIRYDIAFEIVSIYNKVLLQNGRTPTFIDPSYVENELQNASTRIIKDARTADEFLISTKSIKDSQGNSQGIVLVGQSLHSVNETLNTYLIFSLIFSFAVLFPVFIWISGKKFQKANKDLPSEKHPKSVIFNVKESVIRVDGNNISIPYATNQYYLCKALFSHPNKRWELDELLIKFGEDPSSQNWRKVYDAAVLVNKRVGFRLISYADKTFRLSSFITFNK